MEKNNSKVIITILSVLVLCLAGFIVYDKTLNNNSKENTNNCPKCETVLQIQIIIMEKKLLV